MSHVLRASLAFALALGALALAGYGAGAIAQDRNQKKVGEEKEVVFLTDSDGALGRRLRGGSTVDMAVIAPYEYAPTSCTLSEFRKVEGAAPPQGTNYVAEPVLLRLEPPLKSKCYFLESIRNGATLKGITAKGTCEAVLRWRPGTYGDTLAVTVCVAEISPYSDKVRPGEEIQFLTDTDGTLGKRLRERGRVDLAVIEPYTYKSAPCTLSDFKNLEGKAPQGTGYFGEAVRFHHRPAPTAAGYFPDGMHLGATLRDITAKGTCQAVLRWPEIKVPEKTVALTVCRAKISGYSDNVQLSH
jgi:hypothetical protein